MENAFLMNLGRYRLRGRAGVEEGRIIIERLKKDERNVKGERNSCQFVFQSTVTQSNYWQQFSQKYEEFCPFPVLRVRIHQVFTERVGDNRGIEVVGQHAGSYWLFCGVRIRPLTW